MMKKISVGLILIFLVSLTAYGATNQIQTVSRNLDISDNPFIALRELKESRAKFADEQVRCFLLEEEKGIARFILEKYFEEGQITKTGENYWRNFPLAGIAYRYNFEPSEAARSFALAHFIIAQQKLDFCGRKK